MILNKNFNLMLNTMLKNNPYAKECYIKFMNKLYAEEKYAFILDFLNERANQKLVDDDCQIFSIFEFNRNIIEIWQEGLGYLKLDLMPITEEQKNAIPFDQENDIFLDNEDGNIFSPAMFNLIYNPTTDDQNGVDDLDFLFYIVKKKDGFYLISQEFSDAGIHCTKINLEDFIVEPQKEIAVKKKKFFKKSSTNQQNN